MLSMIQARSVLHPFGHRLLLRKIKSSPYLDAVNVAGLGVGFAPGITPMLVSMAVPVAVRMAKTTQTEKK
jgi:hypothetical protein